MRFSSDRSKQMKEAMISRKTSQFNHSKLFFNNAPVSHVGSKENLEANAKIAFNIYIESILTKVNKMIDLIRKLQCGLARSFLVTIYSTFI